MHYIPHVNNPGMTLQALESTVGTCVEGKVVLIDNSSSSEFLNNDLPGGAKVYHPPVPLSTAQTMNWIRKLAISNGLPHFGFQHNDGLPAPGTINKLYELAVTFDCPWGVLFSNYDVCCVFNTQAVAEVGEWDWLRYPFYHLDNDYYNRLNASGYPTVSTALSCLHQNDASNTIKADPRRAAAVSAYFRVAENLLRDEWPQDLIGISL
jgi:hypothetical protein